MKHYGARRKNSADYASVLCPGINNEPEGYTNILIKKKNTGKLLFGRQQGWEILVIQSLNKHEIEVQPDLVYYKCIAVHEDVCTKKKHLLAYRKGQLPW